MLHTHARTHSSPSSPFSFTSITHATLLTHETLLLTHPPHSTLLCTPNSTHTPLYPTSEVPHRSRRRLSTSARFLPVSAQRPSHSPWPSTDLCVLIPPNAITSTRLCDLTPRSWVSLSLTHPSSPHDFTHPPSIVPCCARSLPHRPRPISSTSGLDTSVS